MPLLGLDGGVGAFVPLPPLLLVFEKRVNSARIHRQSAAGQIEGMRAGGGQERPVVRNDQARGPEVPQEVFEHHGTLVAKD